MELRGLRYFTAVADELHFRRAAERLSISQPALTLQIQNLEHELGVELLHRTKREVRLTPAGKVFLEFARATLADADRAMEFAQRAQRGQLGQLILSFTPACAYALLPPLIRTYARRYPEVELVLREMGTSAQVAALRAREVHVAILHPPIDTADLKIKLISRERMVIALPVGHPLAKKSELTFRELADEPWIRSAPEHQTSPPEHSIAIWRAAAFEPRTVLRADQIPTVLGMVAVGMGVCLLPPAARRLRFRGVVYRPLRGATEFVTAAVWRVDTIEATARAFVEILEEAMPDPRS